MFRFKEKNGIRQYATGIRISILVFVLFFFFFINALRGLSKDTIDRQEQSLTLAINRAIVSCYSVEGTYPPSLDYLLDHYGITYNRDLFFVDYQAIGSNIYPDVTIIRKVVESE